MFKPITSQRAFKCRATTTEAIRHHRHIPKMPSLSIAVQPPQEAQVGEVLYPTIIAKMPTRSSDEGYYFFSMAILLGHDGSVIDGALAGAALSTGVVVDSHVVFVFSDLSITLQGEYKIRLDVYKVTYEDPNGAAFNTQTETRGISVVERVAHQAKPCMYNPHEPLAPPSLTISGDLASAERSYIRTLQDAGLTVPSRSS